MQNYCHSNAKRTVKYNFILWPWPEYQWIQQQQETANFSQDENTKIFFQKTTLRLNVAISVIHYVIIVINKEKYTTLNIIFIKDI